MVIVLQAISCIFAAIFGWITYVYFGWPAWLFIGSPLVVLAILPFFSSSMHKEAGMPLVGAAIGVFLAVAIPSSRVIYRAAVGWSSGVEFGLGFLIFASPITALILGSLGFKLGALFFKRNRIGENKSDDP